LEELIIKEVHEEIPGFKTIAFDEGHHVSYTPGQYLTLIRQDNSGEEVRRSYSIVSVPFLSEPLTIGVKRVANGFFSRQLVDHAKAGDKVQAAGAGGLFVLPEDIQRNPQIFFLAAGSGITPIFALIKSVLFEHSHVSVVLIYSNSSPAQAIFLQQLLQLQQQFATRFHLELLFSNIADLSKARLYRELLMKFVNQYAVVNFEKILFYVCGPEAYMRMCIYVLQEHHVPANNIRKEVFLIHKKSAALLLPPDKQTHSVTIYMPDREYKFKVHYPDTILQAARKNGITLPYSCETGRCGNCAARHLQGSVWMSYNEVLTQKDIDNGLTLTCVGHPLNSDVELRMGG
jgi:ring-1,2-phenylacetyl-CoA epoxidase subunit PaaE